MISLHGFLKILGDSWRFLEILGDSWRFLEILGVVVFVGDWWDAFSCWRIGGGDCLRFLEEFVGILIVVVTS